MKSKAPIEKKKIVEINASETISGLGEEVVKILDAESGESICYIGHQNEEHRIFFSRPIVPTKNFISMVVYQNT
jgi:hypothetical protein